MPIGFLQNTHYKTWSKPLLQYYVRAERKTRGKNVYARARIYIYAQHFNVHDVILLGVHSLSSIFSSSVSDITMPLSDLWKRKTPEELIRQNQRALNRTIR